MKNDRIEKKFSIGDLVAIESTDPFVQESYCSTKRRHGADVCYALIVERKLANHASRCKYFYRVHICDEDDPDERWLFSDELRLVS